MEAEMKAKPTEKTVTEQKEPWHKPKNGSVFPVKRRSVKLMMLNHVLDKKMFPPPEASKSKKNNSVHPCSSELIVDDMVD